MTDTIKVSRDKAIEFLAKVTPQSENERAEILHSFYANTSWEHIDENIDLSDEDADFKIVINAGLLDYFKSTELSEYIRKYSSFPNAIDSKYDDLIVECTKEDFIFWSNNALLDALQTYGHNVDEVTGKLEVFSCPCCGADTLPERNGWDICPVCWWEDDGTDNDDASLYYSGPNKGMQLTAARICFLQTGIYNPNRTDLMDLRKPIANFGKGRHFEIDKTKGIIFEKGTDWYAPLSPPHLKEDEPEPEISLAGANMRGWPPNIE